jgi:hypothetical protein
VFAVLAFSVRVPSVTSSSSVTVMLPEVAVDEKVAAALVPLATMLSVQLVSVHQLPPSVPLAHVPLSAWRAGEAAAASRRARVSRRVMFRRGEGGGGERWHFS